MTVEHETGYSDLRLRPQIIRNAPLLTFFLSCDRDRLSRRIPRPLSAHARARLILNMWFLDNPDETTGFGATGQMGVSYLAAEVTGPEGASSDGSVRFPGRIWLEHWSSSPPARRYAQEASGLHIMPGETEMRREGDILKATLHIDHHLSISAMARIGSEKRATLSGHSIYYAERHAPVGGREIARFEIPWVSDAYSAKEPVVEFAFPADNKALSFVANGPQVVETVTFRRFTVVPYLSQGPWRRTLDAQT
jgi:hypothetical protein